MALKIAGGDTTHLPMIANGSPARFAEGEDFSNASYKNADALLCFAKRYILQALLKRAYAWLEHPPGAAQAGLRMAGGRGQDRRPHGRD
jgi:hypothetical protein